MILKWSSDQHSKTVLLDRSNIGTMHTIPGYSKYESFCAEAGDYNVPPQNCCHQCNFVEIDGGDSDLFAYDASVSSIPKNTLLDKGTLLELSENLREGPLKAVFDNNIFKDTLMGTDDEMRETYMDEAKPEDLLLLLHYKYGHVPMSRLKKMAKAGLLPKKIADCPSPICQSCIYGKMTRKAWRTKPSNNATPTKVATYPGEIVSVDQLESPVDGFIAQMKGRL